MRGPRGDRLTTAILAGGVGSLRTRAVHEPAALAATHRRCAFLLDLVQDPGGPLGRLDAETLESGYPPVALAVPSCSLVPPISMPSAHTSSCEMRALSATRLTIFCACRGPTNHFSLRAK